MNVRTENWVVIVLNVEETLHSLKGNGFKYEMKVEHRKANRQLLERKDLLAVLPTGYRKLRVLVTRRTEATCMSSDHNSTNQH